MDTGVSFLGLSSTLHASTVAVVCVATLVGLFTGFRMMTSRLDLSGEETLPIKAVLAMLRVICHVIALTVGERVRLWSVSMPFKRIIIMLSGTVLGREIKPGLPWTFILNINRNKDVRITLHWWISMSKSLGNLNSLATTKTCSCLDICLASGHFSWSPRASLPASRGKCFMRCPRRTPCRDSIH